MLFHLKGQSQSYDINKISQADYKLIEIDALFLDDEVVGYFTIRRTHERKKKTKLINLEILDTDLNSLGKISIHIPLSSRIIQVLYNNQFLLVGINGLFGKSSCRIFNMEGELIKEYKNKFSTPIYSEHINTQYDIPYFAIPDRGFLMFNKKDKILFFISTDAKYSNWSYDIKGKMCRVLLIDKARIYLLDERHNKVFFIKLNLSDGIELIHKELLNAPSNFKFSKHLYIEEDSLFSFITPPKTDLFLHSWNSFFNRMNLYGDIIDEYIVKKSDDQLKVFRKKNKVKGHLFFDDLAKNKLKNKQIIVGKIRFKPLGFSHTYEFIQYPVFVQFDKMMELEKIELTTPKIKRPHGNRRLKLVASYNDGNTSIYIYKDDQSVPSIVNKMKYIKSPSFLGVYCSENGVVNERVKFSSESYDAIFLPGNNRSAVIGEYFKKTKLLRLKKIVTSQCTIKKGNFQEGMDQKKA